MIRSIKITNYRGESLDMVLTDPSSSGFIIQSIDGLGPVKATINTTQMSSATDGALFNSAKRDKRNIVMKIEFMVADPTKTGLDYNSIEDVRQKSYKFFPLKKNLVFTVETDNRILYTVGYVEKNDPDIFSKKESAQISIICPDPNLYMPSNQITNFSGVDAGFEFPFENNSVADDVTLENTQNPDLNLYSVYFLSYQSTFEFPFENNSLTDLEILFAEGDYYLSHNLIEFGEINLTEDRNVVYTGDAEVGIIITMHFIGSVSNIVIYDITTRKRINIYTDKIKEILGSAIQASDDIIISTIRGHKSAQLLRAGTYTNILNAFDKDVEWFEISKGNNIFAYTAESGYENIQFSIENKVAYEGI